MYPFNAMDKLHALSPLLFAVVLCGLITLAPVAEAKYVEGVVNPSQGESFHYLSKYCFGYGMSWVNTTVHKNAINKGHHLAIFMDEDWPAALAEQNCEERLAMARIQFPLEGIVPKGEEYVDYEQSVEMIIRPHFWFAAVVNCNDYKKKGTPPPFSYSMTFKNDAGSHFAYDESGLLPLHALVFVAYFIFGSLCLTKIRGILKQDNKVHAVIKVFMIVIILQAVKVLLELAHLFRYNVDGVGMPTMSAASEAMELVCQLVLSSIFMLISQGYTVSHETIPGKNLLMVGFGVIFVTQVASVVIAQQYDEAHDVFTSTETVLGVLIIAVRITLFVWFIVCLSKSVGKETNERKRLFYRTFAIAGTLWFLAYPFVILLANVFAPYLRHKVVTGGALLLQSFVLKLLYSLFLTRGAFFKMSTLSSNILPGMKME